MQAFVARERFVEAGGTRVRYLEAGEGLPLLLLHGIGQSSTAWRRVLPALASTHRVFAIDLPGFGGSPPPASGPYGGPKYFGRVVAEFATALDLATVDAIGHSAGGLALLNDALDHPARYRRLVVVDPAGFTPTPDNLLGNAASSLARLFVSAPHNRAVTRALYATAFFDASKLDEETVDELDRRHHDAAAKHVARTTLTKFIDYCRRLEPFHERLSSLRTPVLAIWGRDDRLFHARRAETLQRLVPQVRIEVFERCGHCPQIEAPARFAETVAEFLSLP